MLKLTACCIATTALLALTLFVQASPASAMAGTAGLHSAIGAGPVILVQDGVKKKSAHRSRGAGQNQQMMQHMKKLPPEMQQYMQQGGQGGGQGGGGGYGGQ
jgi:hypothetical protein